MTSIACDEVEVLATRVKELKEEIVEAADGSQGPKLKNRELNLRLEEPGRY